MVSFSYGKNASMGPCVIETTFQVPVDLSILKGTHSLFHAYLCIGVQHQLRRESGVWSRWAQLVANKNSTKQFFGCHDAKQFIFTKFFAALAASIGWPVTWSVLNFINDYNRLHKCLLLGQHHPLFKNFNFLLEVGQCAQRIFWGRRKMEGRVRIWALQPDHPWAGLWMPGPILEIEAQQASRHDASLVSDLQARSTSRPGPGSP